MELTVSKEDYLKAIAEAEAEEGRVIAATLGRWLKVSAPAVALALRRLKRDRLVWVDARGRILLTKAGRQVADKLRLRHHLIERMLHETLGLEWYKVHEEAERLEHSISEEVERKLIEKLGPAGLCPHGNPIHKGAAERRKRGWICGWRGCRSGIRSCWNTSTNWGCGRARFARWRAATTTARSACGW